MSVGSAPEEIEYYVKRIKELRDTAMRLVVNKDAVYFSIITDMNQFLTFAKQHLTRKGKT